MNKVILDHYVVEYSVMQKCFYYDKFYKIIEKNLRDAKEKKSLNDYKIIGIFETIDGAVDYIKHLKNDKII